MFSKIVNAYVIPVVDLRLNFNFNQFYHFIRDLLRIHTPKVGSFIFMNYASNNEGNEIP